MQSSNNMYGVVDGVYICNQERTVELDQRISSRNIPSTPLKPQMSFRPALTKYSVLPIVNNSNNATVPFKQYDNYDQHLVFNPGTSAPWYGFANNINLESALRNQYFALQDCDKAGYIPSSKSDLYVENIPPSSIHEVNPHQLLFNKEQFSPTNPNTHNLGKKLWHNHTKQDLLEKYDNQSCGSCQPSPTQEPPTSPDSSQYN
jgi:hypothetical protein